MQKYLRNRTTLICLLCLVFFGVGIILGRVTEKTTVIKPKVLREGGYKYINPVLLCNTNNNQAYNEDTTLSKALIKYTEGVSENDISVYFLSLLSGKWASVNENETFSPASMLKVPTMVETLKYAELHPEILSKQVYYDGSFDDNKVEYFKPQKTIQSGWYYSVDNLLTSIITYSDNNALRLLHDTIALSSFQNLYKDLKIDIPANSIDFMSAKTYSLFLRVLYNSTYLTRESSEKALKLMTTSDFPQGLKSGVPSFIDIANKFGERQVFTPNGTLTQRELHDCGIVYAPDNPYVLCVMTRGQNFDSLISSIKNISALVYNQVVK